MFQKNNLFIISNTKVSDIIFDNTFFLLLLEHFGIELALHEKTVEQICLENNINLELFLTIANLYNGFNPTLNAAYSSRDIQTIIYYLKNSHQYYLKEKYPQIQDYIKQIYKINNHPEILMIDNFFEKYFIEVIEHLDYENKIVFPYILNLDNKLLQKNQDVSMSSYSVTEYREHHNDIEEELTDLKNLLIKYLPQKNDQQIRRKLLFCLFELEYDLKIHSQIEDSILIPLVEKMEQLVNQRK